MSDTEVSKARSLLDNVVDIISITDELKGAMRGQALTDTNKLAVVSPFCIYTRDLDGEDYLSTLQSIGLNLFTSYYLRAVDVIARVDAVVVNRVLGDVNPDVGLEHATLPLDYLEELPMPSMEARWKPQAGTRQTDADEEKTTRQRHRTGKAVSSAKAGVNTNWNKDGITALGKEIEVSIEVKRGNKVEKVKVGALIKIINVPMSKVVLAPRLALARRDNDMGERWERVKLGNIKFWRDFVWNEDIIEEEKKIMAHPDADVLNAIKERHRKGMLRAVRGRGKAYGVGSNIVITTTNVIREVETMSHQYIDRGHFLNEMFESMGFMILMVVDKEDEMVTIYIKGTRKGSVHTIKSLKKADKTKGGIDIVSVMKDLQQSDVPVF